MNKNLESLGWSGEHEMEFHSLTQVNPGLKAGRVVFQGKGLYKALGAEGEFLLSLGGRFSRRESLSALDLPTVGDWVLFRDSGSGQGQITELLRRQSVLVRKGAGTDGSQLLAANTYGALVITSLNHDLSVRRLERYLSMIRSGGVRALVVLSKADLFSDDPITIEAEVERIRIELPDVEIRAISCTSGYGVEALRQWLSPQRTYVMLGSSGVGKSTLVNLFLGHQEMLTQAARGGDDKGRHTTTARHLKLSASGVIFLDTPGMRELQLEADHSDINSVFDDLAQLEARCRFSNCRHETESACAVKAALACGEITENRWNNYQKLKRELAHQERRHDKGLALKSKREWKKKSQEAATKLSLKKGSVR